MWSVFHIVVRYVVCLLICFSSQPPICLLCGCGEWSGVEGNGNTHESVHDPSRRFTATATRTCTRACTRLSSATPARARRWRRASRTCGRRMGTHGRSRTTTRRCGQRGRPRQQLTRRRRPWPHDYVKHLKTGHICNEDRTYLYCRHSAVRSRQRGHHVWLLRFSCSRPDAVNMLIH